MYTPKLNDPASKDRNNMDLTEGLTLPDAAGFIALDDAELSLITAGTARGSQSIIGVVTPPQTAFYAVAKLTGNGTAVGG